MPTLNVVNFNIVCATLGGFITLFGLVSYLLKEKFYLSEALISTLAGLVFSPHAANFVKPLDYANDNEIDLETVTLYFARLVLGVQLVLAGVQLPSKYLRKEWKSLSLLLGPGMCIMWISTSLLVWGLVPDISFLFALGVGACVTPTDPVLSNSIVKGQFADKNIPPSLQKIIIAESGANDGLGYPFLFLALYLIKYTGDHGLGVSGGAGQAIGLWFYDTWAYVIILSVVYGAVVGWLAKELLHWAEQRKYVDRESFLVFAITLALFIVGTVGMLGSDDVLACFIAGNAFTWDDWFRLETMDDSLQPTIDMLLNVSIFMWFGAVCPWHKFVANDVIPIYRLIPLGILILLLRRLPMVFAFHKKIHQIEHTRHALFVGFFGPIGVSAIFYLYISREFLREVQVDGQQRTDTARLAEIMDVTIWFLVVCSIVVHGLSIPVGKLGIYLPRTISTAISFERSTPAMSRDASLQPGRRGFVTRDMPPLGEASPRESDTVPASDGAAALTSWTLRSVKRVGKKVWSDLQRRTILNVPPEDGQVDKQSGDLSADSSSPTNTHPEISAPRDARPIGRTVRSSSALSTDDAKQTEEAYELGVPKRPLKEFKPQRPASSRIASPERSGTPLGWQRSIRFPDDPTPGVSSPAPRSGTMTPSSTPASVHSTKG